MSRPLREATTYLVLAFSLAIGIAVAMPHAGINVLLSAFVPITALIVITFTRTPRGKRRALWAQFGLNRSGKHCGRLRRRAHDPRRQRLRRCARPGRGGPA